MTEPTDPAYQQPSQEPSSPAGTGPQGTPPPVQPPQGPPAAPGSPVTGPASGPPSGPPASPAGPTSGQPAPPVMGPASGQPSGPPASPATGPTSGQPASPVTGPMSGQPAGPPASPAPPGGPPGPQMGGTPMAGPGYGPPPGPAQFGPPAGEQPPQFGPPPNEPVQYGVAPSAPGPYGPYGPSPGEPTGQFGMAPNVPGPYGPPPGEQPGQFGPPPGDQSGQFGPPPGEQSGHYGPPPGEQTGQFGMAPGGPGQYGAVPPGTPAWQAPAGAPMPYPAPRKRRTGVLVGGIIAGVVVVGLLIGLVGVPLLQRLSEPSATDKVLTATGRLGHAQVVRYTGGVQPDADDDYTYERVDLRVGQDATVLGDLTRGDASARVVVKDGSAYLHGDRDWLLATDARNAEYRSGHWTGVDSADLGLPVSALTPRSLATSLRADLRANSSHKGQQARELTGWAGTVRGMDVGAYAVPSGAIVYVTDSSPYTVVGVDGSLGSDGYLALNMQAGGGSAASSLSADVAGESDVTSEPDTPAWYSVVPGSAEQTSCSTSSCGESWEVTADSGDTGKQAQLIGLFSSDRAGKHSIGSCIGYARSINPYGTTTVSCTNTTNAWRNWVSKSSSGSYWVTAVTVSPGWQGDNSAETMRDLYEHPGFSAAIDAADTETYRSVIAPSESLQVIDRLLKSGMSASSAMTAVSTINSHHALGAVSTLVTDGHLELASDASFGSDDLPAYVEAARRVAAGSSQVAVGSWTDGGSTYHADVLDISGHLGVFLGSANSAGGAGHDLSAAADQVADGSVPASFRTELRLLVGPRSPLYRQDKAGMLAVLRDAGVTAKDLTGVNDVVLVGGTGTYTVHPSDFD